jgi:hypothetical protein
MKLDFVESIKADQIISFTIEHAKVNESSQLIIIDNRINDALIMDVNGDESINIYDILTLVTMSDAEYASSFDYNQDTIIDIYDVLYLNSMMNA